MCPRCRCERAYAETMRIRGLGNFLRGVDPLFNPDTQDDNYYKHLAYKSIIIKHTMNMCVCSYEERYIDVFGAVRSQSYVALCSMVIAPMSVAPSEEENSF